MNLLLSLNKALTLWPDREAVVDGDVRLTYRQFGRRVDRLASALAGAGLGKGSVAGVIAPNVREYLEIYYGCAAAGVVLNSVNFRLSPREMGEILRDSGARLLFVHADFAASVAAATAACPDLDAVVWIGDAPADGTGYEAFLAGGDGPPPRPRLGADDLAHLYYTSGTTGRPKGVMLTHGNVTFHALAAIAELGLTDADTWAHVAPLFHLADAWAAFAMTWVGARHVCVPYFDAAGVLATIERERVTISNLIPTMLNLMVNHPDAGRHDYGSLRAILSGGAPIAPETVRRIIDLFGCDYVQTYGMTETSPYLTVSLPKAHLRDLPADDLLALKSRTGRPFLGVELKVVRPDGAEVAWDDREVGEIVVRGPTVTPGYWRNPEATAQAIRDGWLHTGDLAVVDAEGYVNIVDRKKDMILTGGENVYSTEVEHVLYEHPDVLECAVVGVPDPKWGEAVLAVVAPRPGARPGEADLIRFVKDRLAHYKAPKRVVFVDELPKTGSGKIYKKGLRDRYAGRG